MNELNVTWMLPSILNLHGDRGNILAFERVGKLLGIKVNVSKIEDYSEKIDFNNTDILFFNPGEIKVMKHIVEYLKNQKEELDNYINSNKFVILIAGSGMIMDKNGLGYLDMECIEREEVYGDDIYFKIDDLDIIGCQIQLVDTKLNSKTCALRKVSLWNGK